MKYALIIFSKLSLILLFGGLSCQQSVDSSDRTEEQTNEVHTAVQISPFLWSVEQVQRHLLNAAQSKVFEVSKTAKYQQGHLPKAQNIWRPDYENANDYPYGGMMAKREEMAHLLNQFGVSSTDTIILYDTKGSVDAMRVLWILTNYGHHNVIVMDGGKTAWEQAGFELTTTIVPSPKNTTPYQFPHPPNQDRVAGIQDIQDALTDTNIILLDTREPEEFLGQPYEYKGEVINYKPGAFASGCIPGAVHLNWSSAVDLNTDHCFKSLEALRYNFEQKGITPDKQIITYCQSGVRSAHTTFVLTELLGFPNVKNYDGSWIEWTYKAQEDTKIPIQQQTSAEDIDAIRQQLFTAESH